MLVKFLRVLICMSIAFVFVLPADAGSASTTLEHLTAPQELHGEFCPAEVARFVVKPERVVAAYVTTGAARTVSVTLTMQTDAGWYRVHVPTLTTLLHVQQLKTASIQWNRNQYVSVPFYFKLPPEATALSRMWVSSAHVTTAADAWHRVGRVACLPDADAFIDLAGSSANHAINLPSPMLLNPLGSLEGPAAPNAQILIPSSIPSPDYNCKRPFQEADVADPFQLRILPPRGFEVLRPMTTSIYLTIGASGTVLASEIGRRSSNAVVDAHALRVVREASFAPARVFCKGAPGHARVDVTIAPGR